MREAMPEAPREVPPLLKRPFRAALWQVAWPTITIGLMRSLYELVDAFWVGRLGLHQLEAIGAVSFATWIVFIMGELAGVGVHSLCSSAEGGGRRREVGGLVVQGLWTAAAASLVCFALLPAMGLYFGALNLDPLSPARAYATQYLTWALLGAPALLGSGAVAAGFRGIGSMRPVLGVTAVCVVVNAILDPLFIWGLPGVVPAMGVAGAAVATQISNWLALFLSARALLKQGIELRWAKPHLRRIRQIASIGAPMAGAGMAFTCVYIALGRLLRGLGEANLAALGLGHRVESIAFVITEGFAAATATVVGQWIGARDEGKARESARKSSNMASLVMLLPAVLLSAAAGPVVGLFTTEPSVQEAAISYLRVITLVFPFMAQEMVWEGALAGAGDTARAFAGSLAVNALRVPLAALLAAKLGVVGVWYAIAGTTVLKAFIKGRLFRYSKLPLLHTPVAAAA